MSIIGINGKPYTWVRYKIVAYDYAGNNATLGEAESYWAYHVIPEFPSSLILPLLIIPTLLAVIIYRRKKLKVNRGSFHNDLLDFADIYSIGSHSLDRATSGEISAASVFE